MYKHIKTLSLCLGIISKFSDTPNGGVKERTISPHDTLVVSDAGQCSFIPRQFMYISMVLNCTSDLNLSISTHIEAMLCLIFSLICKYDWSVSLNLNKSKFAK